MKRLTTLSSERLVVMAALVGLVALALMAVGVLVPLPLPVIAAMSVGQMLGGVAVLLYGAAVLSEMRKNRQNQEREQASSQPESGPGAT